MLAQRPHVSSLANFHSALQDLLARNFSLIILGKASRTDGTLPGHDLCSVRLGTVRNRCQQLLMSCCPALATCPSRLAAAGLPWPGESSGHAGWPSSDAPAHWFAVFQGGGRRDSSIVRIPEELVEAGLIKQYEKLPFQVRSFVWLGSWHSGP